MKILSLFLILLISSSCSTGPLYEVLPSRELISFPEINKIHEVDFGETLVKKGVMRTYKTLALESNIAEGTGVVGIIIPKQHLFNTIEDKEWDYYEAQESYKDIMDKEKEPIRAGIRIHKKNKKIELWTRHPHNNHTLSKQVRYKISRKSKLNTPRRIQELIYNGKQNNQVSFIYKEFIDNEIQPRTQVLNHSLKDGDLIGIKGLRIKVLASTNISIKYKLIQNFK